jgi:hypothetical protein
MQEEIKQPIPKPIEKKFRVNHAIVMIANKKYCQGQILSESEIGNSLNYLLSHKAIEVVK